jgi:VanZ family protein
LKQRRFFFYWMPVIAYAAFILTVSSIPGSAIKLPFSWFDKIAHVVEYGLLSLLVGRALRGPRTSSEIVSRADSGAGLKRGSAAAVITIVAVVAFGVIDETYQSTHGRDADIYDLAADAAGACLAQGLVAVRSAARSKEERKRLDRRGRMIAQ